LQVCLVQVFDEQEDGRQQVATSWADGVEALVVQYRQGLTSFRSTPANHKLL
jgi:hypothetical protein